MPKRPTLDLSEVLSHVGLTREYPIDVPAIVEDPLYGVDAVRGSIRLTNSGSALIVAGRVDTVVQLECCRCLAPMVEAIGADLDEQFVLTPSRSRRSPAAVEEEETELSGRLFQGAILDLAELLRQVLTPMLPSRPLHSADCLGLCSQCGKDLNEGPCGCLTASEASRSRLGTLLSELRDRSG